MVDNFYYDKQSKLRIEISEHDHVWPPQLWFIQNNIYLKWFAVLYNQTWKW